MTSSSDQNIDALDCVVVGAGPAGLTAALYLARFRRDIRLFDSGASRVKWIPRSHNLPGFLNGMHGRDLLDVLSKQVASLGVEVEAALISEISFQDGLFQVSFGADELQARTILLSTGVVETVPPVAGIAEAIKRGLVRVCPICDGFEAQNRIVGVLGDGDHAAREALFLRTYANSVTLLLTSNGRLSLEVETDLAASGVQLLRAEITSIEVHERDVTAICLANGEPRDFDVVYSAFGSTPQVKLARALGVKLDERHRILVDEHQATSTPGVFAAGDVVRGLNQIAVAEGEAAIAATAIHNLLARNLAP